MKILDAGTEVLDDYDVLKFIREKRAQHDREKKSTEEGKGFKSQRPANFLKALQKHEEHLLSADRPFLNNTHYDDENTYLTKLIQTLGPHVQLTKSEYLVLVNQRPYRRKHLGAMIEDIDTRFTREQQNYIRDVVVEVLGIKEGVEGNGDKVEVVVKGGGE